MPHCGSIYIGGTQVSLVCNKNTGNVVLIFEEVWEGLIYILCIEGLIVHSQV